MRAEARGCQLCKGTGIVFQNVNPPSPLVEPLFFRFHVATLRKFLRSNARFFPAGNNTVYCYLQNYSEINESLINCWNCILLFFKTVFNTIFRENYNSCLAAGR